jgi:LmbE family N-acetylglucosaminyl deacetylase
LAAVIDESQIERVLVITAHPDDVDFGAAGTVAVFTERGVDVTYCLVSDGDAGGFDEAIPRSDMAALRREEQARAAKEVGVEELIFLGQPDGQLQAGLDLREKLARVIRQVRPDLVITQNPVRNLARIRASHPDHLAVGEATLCAVFPDARNPFAFPHLLHDEGLAPWTVPEVWLFGSGEGSRAVDITEQVDRKLRALRAHESQHEDQEGIGAMVREWNLAVARQHGLDEGRAAELFIVVDTG